jgi:hypothetical protein
MLKISINSRFFIPNMTYYKKKKFHLIFQIFGHETPNREETAQNEENTFPKIVSEIVSQLKKYPMHCQLLKSLYPSVQFLIVVGGRWAGVAVCVVWWECGVGFNWGGVEWVCK